MGALRPVAVLLGALAIAVAQPAPISADPAPTITPVVTIGTAGDERLVRHQHHRQASSSRAGDVVERLRHRHADDGRDQQLAQLHRDRARGNSELAAHLQDRQDGADGDRWDADAGDRFEWVVQPCGDGGIRGYGRHLGVEFVRRALVCRAGQRFGDRVRQLAATTRATAARASRRRCSSSMRRRRA